MTKVLVTGAGGFCGQHLVRYLKAQAVDVHTMGVSGAVSDRHTHLADIGSAKAIAVVLESVQPDYIFHLAGVASAPNAATFYQVNAGYAAALLQGLELSGLAATPTMLVGTSAEYGAIVPEQVPIHETTAVSPYHHYGISKLAQTHMGMAAARMGRPLIMARPFNIIGPGMPAHLSVQSFASQVAQIVQGKQAPVIEVGNLGSSRDFIDVAETMAIYWQLIQNPQVYGQVINVCSGQGVVMADLLEMLIELAGVTVEVKVDPQRFKALDIPVHYGCTQKLADCLGRSPQFDLRASLQAILDSCLDGLLNSP
jgi:GDP-4-dehydro-6-deoxy-D-mannose reductase